MAQISSLADTHNAIFGFSLWCECKHCCCACCMALSVLVVGFACGVYDFVARFLVFFRILKSYSN